MIAKAALVDMEWITMIRVSFHFCHFTQGIWTAHELWQCRLGTLSEIFCAVLSDRLPFISSDPLISTCAL